MFPYPGITPARPPVPTRRARQPAQLLAGITGANTAPWAANLHHPHLHEQNNPEMGGETPPTAVPTPLISRTNTPGSSLSTEVDFPLITHITNPSWLCRAFITGCMAVGDCFKKLPTHGAALAEPVPSAVINANNKAEHHAAFYGLSNAGSQSYRAQWALLATKTSGIQGGKAKAAFWKRQSAPAALVWAVRAGSGSSGMSPRLGSAAGAGPGAGHPLLSPSLPRAHRGMDDSHPFAAIFSPIRLINPRSPADLSRSQPGVPGQGSRDLLGVSTERG